MSLHRVIIKEGIQSENVININAIANIKIDINIIVRLS